MPQTRSHKRNDESSLRPTRPIPRRTLPTLPHKPRAKEHVEFHRTRMPPVPLSIAVGGLGELVRTTQTQTETVGYTQRQGGDFTCNSVLVTCPKVAGGG